MLLFGIIDFSLLFSAWLLIQNMSRQAVRYAVTGDYNPAFCTAGCTTTADQDAARLLSIREHAGNFKSGLLVDSTAILQTEPGYLQVTICSGRDTTVPPDNISNFQAIIGQMGFTHYSECLKLDDHGVSQGPMQDPGGPNDTVIVMVDFNHPYLTPFLNQIWPMIHLISAQRGVVEKFRVSRALSLPPGDFHGFAHAIQYFHPKRYLHDHTNLYAFGYRHAHLHGFPYTHSDTDGDTGLWFVCNHHKPFFSYKLSGPPSRVQIFPSGI